MILGGLRLNKLSINQSFWGFSLALGFRRIDAPGSLWSYSLKHVFNSDSPNNLYKKIVGVSQSTFVITKNYSLFIVTIVGSGRLIMLLLLSSIFYLGQFS